MNNSLVYSVYYPSMYKIPLYAAVFRRKENTRSQATVRREVRRRSNLPGAIQKRLGFKCH